MEDADQLHDGSMHSPIDNENGSSNRRKRAALAAQACETCRSRKTRCDEQRPKCSLCTRLDVECIYREPLPTKKDRSLQQMQEQLNRIESVVNMTLSAMSPNAASRAGTSSLMTPSNSGNSGNDVDNDRVLLSRRSSGNFHTVASQSSREMSSNSGKTQAIASPYAMLPLDDNTSTQQMAASQGPMTWPAIHQFLRREGLSADQMPDPEVILTSGMTFFLKLDMNKHKDGFSAEPQLLTQPAPDGLFPNAPARVTFPTLSDNSIDRMVESYFATFNVMYPILDRKLFYNDIVLKIRRIGFGYGDYDSVLLLLVLALGQLGSEGVLGKPIGMVKGQPSGVRGGNPDTPPGIEVFNEALRRFGFIHTSTRIEGAQAWLLSACYYEASSRHLDYQQCAMSAAMSLILLLRCNGTSDWSSQKGQALSRVYWCTNLMENWFHVDLDLPRTGLSDFEDVVPLPQYDDPTTMDIYEQTAQMQFSALITLRRLISRIHVFIFESAKSSAETQRDFAAPPNYVVAEVIRQLDGWRDLLPPLLQWQDDARFDLPDVLIGENGNGQGVAPLFTEHPLGVADFYEHKSISAMATAVLRSRFYYAKYMTLRPFVYKVLHFPHQTSADERQCAAMCLQACLLWPISMYPISQRKRLIPTLFTWTQNFFSILLVLRMTTVNSALQSIARENLGLAEVETTVRLILAWFRDMKLIDGVADWSWVVLERIYRDVLT